MVLARLTAIEVKMPETNQAADKFRKLVAQLEATNNVLELTTRLNTLNQVLVTLEKDLPVIDALTKAFQIPEPQPPAKDAPVDAKDDWKPHDKDGGAAAAKIVADDMEEARTSYLAALNTARCQSLPP